MRYDPKRHHRRSIRVRNYDYTAPDAYFVTLVCHGRECLFGEIQNGEVKLNALGEIVADEWERTAIIRPNVAIDAYVVMPNHLHGIVVVTGTMDVGGGAHSCAPQPDGHALNAPTVSEGATTGLARSPGSLVSGFKAASALRANLKRAMPSTPVWQRNYFEHIIRNDHSWERIRAYIARNPIRWSEDAENSVR